VVQNGGMRLASGATCVADVPSDCRRAPRSTSRSAPRRSGSTSSKRAWSRWTARSWSGCTWAPRPRVIVELGPGMRVTPFEQNVARAHSVDRWQIGDPVRLGWHREEARVLR
jgi:hypothetical protein